MRKKIYLCHPYGRRRGAGKGECSYNAMLSINWGRKLIEKGFNPYIANLGHFVHVGWDKSPSEDVYFELVSAWIKDCDAVFVAKLPDHEDSGVHMEIKIAEALGISVYYNIEDIK